MRREDRENGLRKWIHPGVREVFRDDTLWVLDKPAGVLSHPNPPSDEASNALLRAPYDFERETFSLQGPGQEPAEIHLVHRLDQDTSGLIICTFGEEAASALKEALFHREVEKEYRALVLGLESASQGEWADHLEKVSGKHGALVKSGRGKINAVTRYSVLERIGIAGLSLLSLRPQTGRTHQLRVQAARRGCPIAGDERYGDFAANRFLSAEIGLKHMFLHAVHMELRHPRTGHVLKLNAPLTSRLALPLEKARGLLRPVPRRNAPSGG